MKQGHEGGGSGIGPGLELGLVQSVFQGFAVIAAEYVHEPAQCVLDNVGGLVIAVGPRLAEVGD